MKLSKSKNANINYLAKIVEINEFKAHPNPEVTKLKCCSVDGFNIICGIDYEPGIYVYFPTSCCLNPNFLSFANLYRHSSMNSNPNETGMFEDNGRVKAIKLKGCISEGFIIPVLALENFILSTTNKEVEYSINDEFDLSKVYNAPSERTGQIIISDKVLDYSYLYEIFHTFGSIANIKSMADTYNKNNKSNLIISGVVLLVFSILTVTGIGGINGVQNRINRKYFVIWYMLGTKTRDCAFIELLRVLAISLFSFIIYICIYYFTPLRENMNISSVYIDGFTFFTAFLFIIILCSITSMDYVIKLGKGNIISAYKNQN